jgi:hypothetical protein
MPRRHRPARLEDGIAFTGALEHLRLIHAEHVAAVIVRRNLPRALRAVGAALPDAGFCRMVSLGDGFRARALLGAEFPPSIVQALVPELERFHAALRVIDAGAGYAQLAVTAGDECRKFHVDYYRLRLLVTYVGPGTEVLPESALDRSALGAGGDDFEAANRAIATSAARIVGVRTGQLVLLKGARWQSGLAAVHRSPPIAAKGEVRLVLKFTVE